MNVFGVFIFWENVHKIIFVTLEAISENNGYSYILVGLLFFGFSKWYIEYTLFSDN